MSISKFQTAISVLYPPRCLGCGTSVDSDFGLCGSCWRDTPFIGGSKCDKCGIPLLGDDDGSDTQCDECMKVARPWSKGRAAMLYKDNARKMVLSLKHGDRTEVAHPAGLWLANAARDILQENALIAPIPLHWIRMVKRKFNQSALLAQALAQALAQVTGLTCCPDLLQRPKKTVSLDGLTRDERFETLDGAFRIHPKRKHMLVGRLVILVDDVMTSGATFAAATETCLLSQASDVCVLSLARVAKDD